MKDLQKIDIRCGTILDVQDIEASDSLVKLTVDLGEEQPRTILCGMKNERQNTAEIIGRQALWRLQYSSIADMLESMHTRMTGFYKVH